MVNTHNITEIFCEIDDFVQEFEKFQNNRSLESGKEKIRNRQSKLNTSEIMTIMVLFHLYGYRNLKTFYLGYV
ncbi:MAG: IS982 family transposase, partial [Ignavibacteria bacterium]|nr:IS982 family transposase [Ignavibacteria bacterium]